MLGTIRLALRCVMLGGAIGLLVWPATVPAQIKGVKIALIVPLSGPWARMGELERAGAELAIEHQGVGRRQDETRGLRCRRQR